MAERHDAAATSAGGCRERSDFLALPIVAAARAGLGGRAVRWRIDADSSPHDFWIVASHDPCRRPEQGWKLHLAAAVCSAEAVLRRALPVILDEDADFKVAVSLRHLAELNDGRGGLSQVGKFITIYPNDDEQAVRLAGALDEATRGLSGPRIPSDRALRPRSLVHYRYGAFSGQLLRTPLGEYLPTIVTPDGELVPDHRLDDYYVPSWVVDPFVAAGVAAELPAAMRRVGSRYAILATLHRSPRSTVYLGLDVDVPRRCAIKRVTEDGTGSFARLQREADALRRLTPDPRFPTPIELFAENGDLYLTMEDMAGQTIEQYLLALKARGMLPSSEQVVRLGRELAAMLTVIHEKGLIYGDLKPSNVLIDDDGRLALIDFELARERNGHRGEVGELSGRGTLGYMSPQQAAGDAPEIADDIYGLGALLYLLATGAEPSRAPDPSALLTRPIELLNPAMESTVAAVIGRCLERIPTRRFASAAEVALALEAAGNARSRHAPSVFGVERHVESEASARRLSLELARRLGDTLSVVAERTPDRRIGDWTRDYPQRSGLWSTDLNVGRAGAILALAELVSQFDDTVLRSALADGARWLAGAPRRVEFLLPGLYVGEAGAGAALLRAGQILGDSALIAAAAERGRWIASVPHSSPDLFNGAAGCLRFHLWLSDETADPVHLRDAMAAGEHLLAVAEAVEGDGVRWVIPPGYGSMSNQALLGYAHGAAGIGDALLDLFAATADERFLAAAQGAGRWLERLAQPALADERGVNWPWSEQTSSGMAFWCHGAAGVGRFLLHLAALGDLPSAMPLAEGAARVVARGARWAGASQCHGLAGNIEYLLDLYQATDDAVYLAEARSLARLLNAFAANTDDVRSWSTDDETSGLGFTIGNAGVAACLLRLGFPETRPHLLSRRGFRHRSAPRSIHPPERHVLSGDDHDHRIRGQASHEYADPSTANSLL